VCIAVIRASGYAEPGCGRKNHSHTALYINFHSRFAMQNKQGGMQMTGPPAARRTRGRRGHHALVQLALLAAELHEGGAQRLDNMRAAPSTCATLRCVWNFRVHL
jgi:hypothetical protein